MTELQKDESAFSGMLTFWMTRFNLSEEGRSRYAEGLLVSANYLDVLGVTPIVGRGFSALTEGDDKVACTAAPAVISYGFWQREFGGEMNAIGKTVSLDGHRFTIGGVTPASFFGVEPGQSFDVALPLCAENIFAKDGKGRMFDKTAYWLTPIARLKTGWSVERATKQVNDLSPAIFRETLPAEYRPDFAAAYLKNKLQAVPAAAGVSSLREQFADPLWILLAISGSVLAIACANLANLLLARASVREREIAVRRAVGASRARVIMQLLTESLLLAVAGGVLGLLLAQVLSRALVAFLSGPTHPIAVPTDLNWHVFGFLAGVAIVTCALFGLAPAIRASGGAPMTAMRGARTSTATREKNGLRRMLVISQVALSLATNLGFDARNVLVASVTLNGIDQESPEKQQAVFRELKERIDSLSAVASAARIWITPISGFGWNDQVHADDDPTHTKGKECWFNRAGPRYFATMGTPLLAGRDFDSHDTLSAPKVAIVNQAFARKLFGAKNPVGRSFRVEAEGNEPEAVYQIVGLVGDTRYRDIREEQQLIAFFPADQDAKPASNRTFVVRGRGSLDSLQAAILRESTRLNRNFLVEFRVLDTQVQQSLLRERLMANLSLAFGVLAGLLSTLGLYGVMSYLVVRRRNEIGLRMALGATQGNVYRLIAKDATIMVTVGLVLGVAACLYLAQYAESMLFELKAKDPFTLVVAALMLAATAMVATMIPARRAARLEPTAALREE
jgi:predicted permease